MLADNALDWDALISRGNNASSQPVLSKWERDSLYVKFDPLVSKREPEGRSSFIFKAPQPKHRITSSTPTNANTSGASGRDESSILSFASFPEEEEDEETGEKEKPESDAGLE